MDDAPMGPDKKRLRLIEEVRRGIDAIKRGDYDAIEAKDISAYIAKLAPKSRKAE